MAINSDQMIQIERRAGKKMIDCHASPEGKSSGLARIQNFKPNNNIVRQSNTSGGGGGGGGGGSCTLAIGQIRTERGG